METAKMNDRKQFLIKNTIYHYLSALYRKRAFGIPIVFTFVMRTISECVFIRYTLAVKDFYGF